MSKVLIVLNHDERMEYIAKTLEKNHEVKVLHDELTLFYELSKKTCDCLILPIRGVLSDQKIDGTEIVFSDNYLMYLKDKLIFTGLVPEEFKHKCQQYDVSLISYLSDNVAIQNNYITTEGVIEALVNHSKKAIFHSNTLIIGYGRLGQILSRVFQTMKANVTIACRHEKDFTHAKISEFQTISLQYVCKKILSFDFIINTIPFQLIDKNTLDQLKGTDIVIVDVASSPYGCDHEYAKRLQVNTLLLPGIPGKIAPITAGKILSEEIHSCLSGGEVGGGT